MLTCHVLPRILSNTAEDVVVFSAKKLIKTSSILGTAAWEVVDISGNVIKNCDSEIVEKIADTIVNKVTEGAIVLGVTYTLATFGVPESLIVDSEIGYIVIRNFVIDE